MKRITALAADYWIENTEQIYKEDLHISTPVMEAYEAGYRKAVFLSSIRGRLAQLENKLVDLEISTLLTEEE